MEIRTARVEDASQLLEIYSQYIDTNITFETELPTLEEFERRIESIGTAYPYLVAQDGERIVGYAYAHRAFERAAYRFDAETTIYLAKDCRHHGLGLKLYRSLLGILAQMNVVNVYALVTGANRNSIYFHQKAGFSVFATFTDTGYKNGEWIDVVWLARTLNGKVQCQPELKNVHEVLPEGYFTSKF